jgi:hypothetical protein
MQSKVKIIRTNDGYMVELPNGEYLDDAHGDNLWDTEAQAEEVVALNYVDLRNYIDYGRKHNTLMEAQLAAYPDSVVLTDHQMYTALQLEVPDWLAEHKYEDWRYYEARHELGYWSDNFYHTWKEHLIEETRARWGRNALLYKWQHPEGFFYACCKKEDGTYRYVGYRYGLDVSEYASGFDSMGYTPREEK